MKQVQLNHLEEPRADWRLPWAATIVLSLGFFAAMHRWDISQVTDFNLQSEFEDIVAGGDMGRRAGFLLFGLFGVVCLLLPARASVRADSLLSWVLLLGAGWCFASVLWSTDQGITIRRLSVVAFCLVAAIGMARQLSLEQLTVVTLAVAVLSAFSGIGVEILLRTFRPWSNEYRFAGALHPNVQGLQCALMSIAAIALAMTGGRRWQIVLSIAAVGLLLLTKSRTALMAFLLAMASMWLVQQRVSRAVCAVCAAVSLVCAILFAVQVIGTENLEGAPSFLLLGRSDDVTTLSGRTDAWRAVVPYIERNPLVGSGYGAFWDLDHISAISTELQWYATNSHSAYLDSALELGVPGAAALACFFVLGIVNAGVLARRAPTAGNLFLLGVLMATALDSCLESLMVQPLLPSLVVFAGVANIAWFRHTATERSLLQSLARHSAVPGCDALSPGRIAWTFPKEI